MKLINLSLKCEHCKELHMYGDWDLNAASWLMSCPKCAGVNDGRDIEISLAGYEDSIKKLDGLYQRVTNSMKVKI